MLLGAGLTFGILGITVAAVWWRFAVALRMHRARIDHGSQVIASRFGPIEFATAGNGPPVLMSHGAAGGFDQGLSAAGPLTAAGYRVVAPSRFGYLRSSSPSDSSPEHQADAFAELLDELGIPRVAVIGLSAGAPAALQFAVRHPDRCRSLTVVVPAAVSAGAVVPAQGALPEQPALARAIVGYVIRSDLLYWLGITLARNAMIRSVLATDPAIVARAGAAERRRVEDILRNILPISKRSRGLLNDTHLAGTPQSIAVERIAVPTLVVSLEDDLYRTLGAARSLAARIPGARLLTYARGGHVFAGHGAELFAAIDTFLRQLQEETSDARSIA